MCCSNDFKQENLTNSNTITVLLFLSLLVLTACTEPSATEVYGENAYKEEFCNRVENKSFFTLYGYFNDQTNYLPKDVCTDHAVCHAGNFSTIQEWLKEFDCVHSSVLSDSIINLSPPRRELIILFDSNDELIEQRALYELRNNLKFIKIY